MTKLLHIRYFSWVWEAINKQSQTSGHFLYWGQPRSMSLGVFQVKTTNLKTKHPSKRPYNLFQHLAFLDLIIRRKKTFKHSNIKT